MRVLIVLIALTSTSVATAQMPSAAEVERALEAMPDAADSAILGPWGPEVIPTLRRIIRRPRTPDHVRVRAVEALGLFGTFVHPSPATTSLLRHLSRSARGPLRLAALTSLVIGSGALVAEPELRGDP